MVRFSYLRHQLRVDLVCIHQWTANIVWSWISIAFLSDCGFIIGDCDALAAVQFLPASWYKLETCLPSVNLWSVMCSKPHKGHQKKEQSCSKQCKSSHNTKKIMSQLTTRVRSQKVYQEHTDLHQSRHISPESWSRTLWDRTIKLRLKVRRSSYKCTTVTSNRTWTPTYTTLTSVVTMVTWWITPRLVKAETTQLMLSPSRSSRCRSRTSRTRTAWLSSKLRQQLVETQS